MSKKVRKYVVLTYIRPKVPLFVPVSEILYILILNEHCFYYLNWKILNFLKKFRVKPTCTFINQSPLAAAKPTVNPSSPMATI